MLTVHFVCDTFRDGHGRDSTWLSAGYELVLEMREIGEADELGYLGRLSRSSFADHDYDLVLVELFGRSVL